MTTQQTIDYENKVIESAKGWITGGESIDNQMELVMIAEHYNIKLPSYCYHFKYSNNPNDLCCTGAHRSLYKLLDKLKAKIIQVEHLTLA